VRVNEAVVASDGGRRIFQYWHIAPDVFPGQTVVAQRDVLGFVTAPAKHVHLTEIVDGVVQNPLQPAHMTPYHDDTVPTVGGLYLRSVTGAELSPHAVTGTISLVARAEDMPALPVPAPWDGLPVSPARVGFELTTPDGREVLPPQTPVDFAETEPGNRTFFDIYAPGTFQNVPAVGKHLFRDAAGEYLYELTPDRLDTAALLPGLYVVTVTAEDTCGNIGTLSETIDVKPQADGAAARESLSDRLTTHPEAWPRHLRRAWTIVIASIGSRQGLDTAREAARLAAAAGVKDVGLRVSSRYRGLHRGSFVVFSGVYFSPDDAEAALGRAQDLYPRAFVREVTARIKPKPKPKRRGVRPLATTSRH